MSVTLPTSTTFICTESRNTCNDVTTVFVDTAGWIALLNTSDTLHSQDRQVMGVLRQQRAQLVTTEWIFVEVADALSAPAYRAKVVAFIAEMQLRLTTAFTSDDHFEQAGYVKLMKA